MESSDSSENLEFSPDSVFLDAARFESTGFIVDAITAVKEYNDAIEEHHRAQKERRNSTTSSLENDVGEETNMESCESPGESVMNQVKNEVLRNFEILLSQHYYLTRLGFVDLNVSLFEWIQYSEKMRMEIFAKRLIHFILNSKDQVELENVVEIAGKVLQMLPVEDFRMQIDEVFSDLLPSLGITWVSWDESAEFSAGMICAPSEDFEDKFCAIFVDGLLAHLKSHIIDKVSVYKTLEQFLFAMLVRYDDEKDVFLHVSFTIQLALRVVVYVDDLLVTKNLIRRMFEVRNVLEEDERVGTLISYLEIAEFINEFLPAPPISVLFPQFSIALATETLSSLLFNDQEGNEGVAIHSELREEIVQDIRLRRAQYSFEWEKLLTLSDEIGPLLTKVHQFPIAYSENAKNSMKSLCPEVLLLALLIVNFLKQKFWNLSKDATSTEIENAKETKSFFEQLQCLKQVFLSSSAGYQGQFFTEHDILSFFDILIVTFVTSLRWTTLVRLSLLWLDVSEAFALVQESEATGSPMKKAADNRAEMIHHLFCFLFSLDNSGSGAHSINGSKSFREFYFLSLLKVIHASLLVNSQIEINPYLTQLKHWEQVDELIFLAQSQILGHENRSQLHFKQNQLEEITVNTRSIVSFSKALINIRPSVSIATVLQLMMVKIIPKRFGVHDNQHLMDEQEVLLTDSDVLLLMDLLFPVESEREESEELEPLTVDSNSLRFGPTLPIFQGLIALLYPKMNCKFMGLGAKSPTQQPDYLMFHTWIVLLMQVLSKPDVDDQRIRLLTDFATRHWTQDAVPFALSGLYQKCLRKALQQRYMTSLTSNNNNDKKGNLLYEIPTCSPDYIGDLFYAPEINETAFDERLTNMEDILMDSSLVSSAFLPYELLQDLGEEHLSSSLLPTVAPHILAEGLKLANTVSPMQSLDDKIVNRLVQQGYSEQGALKAAWLTRQEGTFSAALSYAVMHAQDKDFDHPFVMLSNSNDSRKTKIGNSTFVNSIVPDMTLLRKGEVGKPKDLKGEKHVSNIVEESYRQEILRKVASLWTPEQSQTACEVSEDSPLSRESLVNDVTPTSASVATISPSSLSSNTSAEMKTNVVEMAKKDAEVRKVKSDDEWDSFRDESSIDDGTQAKSSTTEKSGHFDITNSEQKSHPSQESPNTFINETSEQSVEDNLPTSVVEPLPKEPIDAVFPDEIQIISDEIADPSLVEGPAVVAIPSSPSVPKESTSDSDIDFDDDDNDPWKSTTKSTASPPVVSEESVVLPSEVTVSMVNDDDENKNAISILSTNDIPQVVLSLPERLDRTLQVLRQNEEIDALLQEYSLATNDFAFHHDDDQIEYLENHRDMLHDNPSSFSVQALCTVLMHITDVERYATVLDLVLDASFSSSTTSSPMRCAHHLITNVVLSFSVDEKGTSGEVKPTASDNIDSFFVPLSALILPFIPSEKDESIKDGEDYQTIKTSLKYWWYLLRLEYALRRLDSGFETAMASAIVDQLLALNSVLSIDPSSKTVSGHIHLLAYMIWTYQQTSVNDLQKLKQLKQLTASIVDHSGFEFFHLRDAEDLLCFLQVFPDQEASVSCSDTDVVSLTAEKRTDILRKALAEDISTLRRLERLLVHQSSSPGKIAAHSHNTGRWKDVVKDKSLDVKTILRSTVLFPARYFSVTAPTSPHPSTSGVLSPSTLDEINLAIHTVAPFITQIEQLSTWLVMMGKIYHNLIDISFLHILLLTNMMETLDFNTFEKEISDSILPKLSPMHLALWSYTLTGWSKNQIETFLAYHIEFPVSSSKPSSLASTPHSPQGRSSFVKSTVNSIKTHPLMLAVRFLPVSLWQRINELEESQRKTLLTRVASVLPSLSIATSAGHRMPTGSSAVFASYDCLERFIVPFLLANQNMVSCLSSPIDLPIRQSLQGYLNKLQHPYFEYLDEKARVGFNENNYLSSVAEMTSKVAYFLFDHGLAEDGFTMRTLQTFLRCYSCLFFVNSGNDNRSNGYWNDKEELWKWYESQLQSWMHDISVSEMQALVREGELENVSVENVWDSHMELQSARIARLLYTGKHVFAANSDLVETNDENQVATHMSGVWAHHLVSICERLLQTHVLTLWHHLSTKSLPDDNSNSPTVEPSIIRNGLQKSLYSCLDGINAIVAQILSVSTSTPSSSKDQRSSQKEFLSETLMQRLHEVKRLSSMHQLYLQLFLSRNDEDSTVRLVFLSPINNLQADTTQKIEDSSNSDGNANSLLKLDNASSIDSAIGDDVLESLEIEDTKAPAATNNLVTVTYTTDIATVLSAMLDLCPTEQLASTWKQKGQSSISAVRQWLIDLLLQDLSCIILLPNNASTDSAFVEKSLSKNKSSSDDWNDDWGDDFDEEKELEHVKTSTNAMKDCNNSFAFSSSVQNWTKDEWKTYIRRVLFVHGHSLSLNSFDDCSSWVDIKNVSASTWFQVKQRWSLLSFNDISSLSSSIFGRLMSLISLLHQEETISFFMEDMSCISFLLAVLWYHEEAHCNTSHEHNHSQAIIVTKLMSLWQMFAKSSLTNPLWQLPRNEISPPLVNKWMSGYWPTPITVEKMKIFLQWFGNASFSEVTSYPDRWSFPMLFHYGILTLPNISSLADGFSLLLIFRPLLSASSLFSPSVFPKQKQLQRRLDVFLTLMTLLMPKSSTSKESPCSAALLGDALQIFWMSERLPRTMYSASQATQRLVQILKECQTLMTVSSETEAASLEVKFMIPREVTGGLKSILEQLSP